ncbi:RluA family pseudouridine synthase [Loigolactobacillus iwatensis]|uniref:RluA family pseudouridine synthase n=1 Tax=Loigolactobacillus iwatensis TaxID=1267156 RepID=UPI000F7F2A2C|nr:RluA family pseudouridine synthase [Loigolactobacillus iwatensis]
MSTTELTLTITTEKGRIDKVISDHFSAYSRSQVQHWLKAELVQVNDVVVKAKYKVVPNDHVKVAVPEPIHLDVVAQNIPLDIVYEDNDVVVVNKPQGMVVHPAAGHPDGTLVNALLYHCELSSINGVIRPGIVHRIDKDTSGLLMVAKNDQAHLSLAAQLKAKTTIREYIALVHGVIKEEQGTIDAPIARAKNDRKKQAVVSTGKHAVTHFTVLERFENFTLVKCILETGRTHQIRVHMKYIGHPLAGDPLYGPKKTLKGNGQFLHAAKLGFRHPTTDKLMIFERPIPEIFQQTLTKLRQTKLDRTR